jgi:hypothetical protein
MAGLKAKRTHTRTKLATNNTANHGEIPSEDQLDASFLTFPLKDLGLSSLRLLSVITLLRPSLLPLPVPSTHAYYSVRRCSLCRCPPAPGLLFS